MARTRRSSPDLKKLLAAADYRGFLNALIADAGKDINFSDLSRRAGFSSRSYIKEVIAGKKRLTATSMAKFKKAFHLSGPLATYFGTLVELEEPDVNVEALPREVLLAKLEKIRLRLTRQKNTGHANKKTLKTDEIFKNRYVPLVFASLGSLEGGASLTEIQSRCGLNLDIINSILLHFTQQGLIESKEERYFVKDSELDLFGLGNDINFLNVYIEAISSLRQRAQKGINSKSELFMHSAFTVKAERLPEIKTKLKTILLEFLDEEQIDDGDKIAQLTLGLHI